MESSINYYDDSAPGYGKALVGALAGGMTGLGLSGGGANGDCHGRRSSGGPVEPDVKMIHASSFTQRHHQHHTPKLEESGSVRYRGRRGSRDLPDLLRS